MNRQLVLKLMVNDSISKKDLKPFLISFVKQSLRFELNSIKPTLYSIRMSYSNLDEKVIYVLLTERNNDKSWTTEKIVDDVLHKIKNRKVESSLIKSFHLHITYP